MLLLVPGDPGGPYWVKERVFYGVIPLLAGLLSLAISIWIATLYSTQADPVGAIMRNTLYAAVGVFLVLASLIVNDLYVHVPIHTIRVP